MSGLKKEPDRFSRLSRETSSPSFLAPRGKLELYNYMVNNIGDELMLLTSSGAIVYANETAAQGLGYSRRRLFNKSITGFFKNKISPREWRRMYFQELKKRKKPIRFRIERVMKNGRVQTVEMTAVYMRYGREEYVLSIGRDISARMAEEERLRETDKMKALSLFVSGTALEIKHPLEAILTRIQQMMQKYKDRDFEYIGFKEFREIINTVQNVGNQVRYCCDIANKLLVLNKKRAGIKEEHCLVHDVIHHSLEVLSKQFKVARVKVKMSLAVGLPAALISASELDEVIVDVSVNAIQAMPSGGLLTVRTALDEKKDYVVLEFKDNGIGIARENLSRIFEPFFTTKQGGPGQNAGLGLSIVYSIVKGYGGDVLIKSSLRNGTAIKILLPVAKKFPKRSSR